MWKTLILVSALVVAPCRAWSSVVIELSDSEGDPNVGEVEAGMVDTLQIDILLTVDGESVIGVGFWIREAMKEGFSITAREITAGSPFTILTSSNGQVTTTSDTIAGSGPDNLLGGSDMGDAVNDRDLGGLTADLVPFSNAIQKLMTLTLMSPDTLELGDMFFITIAPSPQGVSLEWVEDGFISRPFDGLGQPYKITVVPEPSTVLLLGLGLVGLAERRRRRA